MADYLSQVEDIDLAPDLQGLLAKARRIGATDIGPAARAVDEERRFPLEAMTALHRAGLTTLYVPKADGGMGLDPAVSIVPQTLLASQVSGWCSSTAQIYGAHINVLRYIALSENTEARRFFQREALEGRFFASFGAEASANKFAIGSRLERDGDSYLLTGRKQFATSSTGSSWALWTSVNAQGDILLPVVDLRAPGIEIIDNWAGVGQRGTGSGVVTANNVRIPAAHVLTLDAVAGRFPFLENVVNLIFGAQYAGVAAGAYRAGLAYVRERTRPWRGIATTADDPLIRLRIADLAIGVITARQMILHAARMFEHLAGAPEQDALVAVAVGQGKVVATEAALAVSAGIFQVMGASSATATHGFDRYFRDARTLTLHDPVDRRRDLIGAYELGAAGENLSSSPSNEDQTSAQPA